MGFSIIAALLGLPFLYEEASENESRGDWLNFMVLFGTIGCAVLIGARIAQEKETESVFWARFTSARIKSIESAVKTVRKDREQQTVTRIMQAITIIRMPHAKLHQRVLVSMIRIPLMVIMMGSAFFSSFFAVTQFLILNGLISIDGRVTVFVLDNMAKGALFDFMESYQLELFTLMEPTLAVQTMQFFIRSITSFALLGFVLMTINAQGRNQVVQHYFNGEKTGADLYKAIETEFTHAIESPHLDVSPQTRGYIRLVALPYYKAVYEQNVVPKPTNALKDMEAAKLRFVSLAQALLAGATPLPAKVKTAQN